MNSSDVLVVGAGPVGLAAACQLARHGARVRVVEALEHPTTESRAVGVHARTLEVLAALGVLDRLEARGRRIGALEMVDGRTGATRVRMDLADLAGRTRHPYVLDVAQPDTEAVLAERAAELGVTVERGVRLTDLTQDADGVTVTLATAAGEQTARAAWVVGADGGHSTVRHLAGSRLDGVFHGQHFAMADVDARTPFARDAIRMITHPDGMGMFFPLAGERARIMFLVDEPGAGDPTLAQFQAWTDARMGPGTTLSNPRWLTYFEVHHAQVPRYRIGRVLLAGDAAHVHSPAAAQGMNTGIQDAANLGWKLALVARGRAAVDLLDTYQEERHPVGAAVVRETTLLTDVGAGAGGLAALRDALFAVVGHLRPLRDVGAATMAEVTLGYRHSTLSVQHGAHHHGSARAGDRAPDAAGDRPAVEDLLAEPGFVLLADDRVAELRAVLGDLGRVVPVGDGPAGPHPDGVRPGGMSLVRPDGYLGLVADEADPALLRRYLAYAVRVVEPSAV